MFATNSLYLSLLIAYLAVVQCCTKTTFEHTRFTALKNVIFDGEVTDYNYFSKAKEDNVASIRYITGCLTPIDELEDVVAIEIRGQNVPIFYESAVQNLAQLHTLYVESCHVNVLKPKAFQNLPSLSVLKIIDNNIESVPNNVFNNLLVTRLVLKFNNISYIAPGAFDDMPRLESVNLNNNKLTVWSSDWFANCPKVNFLSAKFNELTLLPVRAFKHVQDTLQRLYLDENNIKNVSPRAFSGLRKLTDLNLHNNNITALDDTTFLYMEKLKMIDLSDTSIGCLSETLLNSLRSDVLLNINNTPFEDQCLENLQKWRRDNDNHLTFFKVLKNVTSAKDK